MIYKESKENLFRQGLIKKCLLDWKSINNLIKRAYSDLKTAKRNIDACKCQGLFPVLRKM